MQPGEVEGGYDCEMALRMVKISWRLEWLGMVASELRVSGMDISLDCAGQWKSCLRTIVFSRVQID